MQPEEVLNAVYSRHTKSLFKSFFNFTRRSKSRPSE